MELTLLLGILETLCKLWENIELCNMGIAILWVSIFAMFDLYLNIQGTNGDDKQVS